MKGFEKGTGIVCEYNPFHKGHAYQINALKDMGANFVVCAMSGDFVQRGEAAFQEKVVRAQNAVENGADIVLEIPFPFCSLGAEGFAAAGISILSDSGLCSSFGFGSECADVQMLSEIADVLTPSFRDDVVEMQKKEPNLSYAAARERLLEKRLTPKHSAVIRNPNDILAVEYIKANKDMVPIAVKRETPRGGHDESFASSSYIRKSMAEGGFEKEASRWLPENYRFDGIYENTELFYKHVLLSLMQKKPQELSDIAEVGVGCEHSIIKNAVRASSYDELCRLLASKTLTDAKIRRMLLFSFFGVTKGMAKSKPLYTTVLAASQEGRKRLKEYADDRKIIVASRIADIKRDEQAYMQYCFARRAGEVLEKCVSIIR